jgi:hypothetical protein
MKMKLILVSFLGLLYVSSEAQLIQGSIRSGVASNQVELWVKPNFNNNAPATQYLYQLGFPVAFPASAVPPPTSLLITLAPEFITTFGNLYSVSVNSVAQNTGGTEKYYNIVLIRGAGTAGSGSLPQSWSSGTEYRVLTATFQGSSATAKVKLADYQDGGSDGQGNFYTVDGNNNYYVTSNSFGNFYSSPGPTGSSVGGDASAGFSETTSLISLPVNLLNFSGYKNGSKNTLLWTTANEENNRGFAVQRSLDGSAFEDIGFVNSQAPGGFSAASISYTFDDMNPSGRKQYYRLRQVDIDGKSKLSNIISITGDRPAILGIGGLYPNPARSQVNVIIDAPERDKITVVVTDMAGKIVKQQLANVDRGSNTIPVDIAALASGSYLVKLRCQSSDCETATGKFNKQ